MTATTRRPESTFSSIFQLRSLKTRVTLFTLAIFVIGIWSLAFYASRMLRADMERLLSEQQFSTVSIIAADINTEMDNRLKALEKVTAKITPAILGNTASMQKFLEDRPALESMFSGGLFVTRLDGTAIASVPVAMGRIGVNYIERNYVVGALEGKITIGKPSLGKKLGVPSVLIGSPIRGAEGKVIGVLIGAINLSIPNFLDKITDNRYGKTGGYLLVAPQYRLIITATEKSRIMEVLPAIGINPFIDRAIKGWEGSGLANTPLGVEVLSSIKGIPVSGWYIAALTPTTEAFAPIRAMQKRMMLASIFMTLLASGLTWWMLKRQLAPVFTTIKTLTALSDTAQPPQPLPITRQDEIGELIGGFNTLLETLGQREGDLKESKAEISQLNAELEQRVIDRTAQLEAANKELEAFCYSVSHDLRAPLRHIDGYVDLLVARCRDGLTDTGLHYVDTIADSARQMGVLIDDLLEFSRTGRAEMRRESMDMNQALNEALTQVQESSSGRSIEWVIGDLPTVRGDYALLRQVWANLLGNAVKYTRTREVARIEVRAREENDEIIFVIADNGVGFDMQYVDKLFGVFQRLHPIEQFEGTGIGLATVQRIINRHGGRVWAEGELDKGAKFCFALPG